MGQWFGGEQKGERPPLSRDEAIQKARGYAQEAKGLAEAKGMKGYVKKADELLAESSDCKGF